MAAENGVKTFLREGVENLSHVFSVWDFKDLCTQADRAWVRVCYKSAILLRVADGI